MCIFQAPANTAGAKDSGPGLSNDMSTLNFGVQGSSAAATHNTAQQIKAEPASQDAKPAISFACLIGMAIMDSPHQRLTVSEVYDWMKKAFPYFSSHSAGTGWKNSVRHNLSLNKHFVKQVRKDCPETGGKGSYWCIRPESIPIMEAAIRKQHSPEGYLSKSDRSAVNTAAIYKKKTSRRAAPPSLSTSPRRPHTFNLREAAQQSPSQTSDREAASMLFSMTRQHVDGTAMTLSPRADGSLNHSTQQQHEFPSLKNGRATTISSRLQAFSAPGSRIQSGIKASYNLNAHKLANSVQPSTAGMFQAASVGSHRHQRGHSAPAVPIQFCPMKPDDEMTGPATQYNPIIEQRRLSLPDASAAPNLVPTTHMTGTNQKLFTFSAPMSMQGGSRCTPEYGNPRSRIGGADSMDAKSGGTLSPVRARISCHPLCTPWPCTPGFASRFFFGLYLVDAGSVVVIFCKGCPQPPEPGAV